MECVGDRQRDIIAVRLCERKCVGCCCACDGEGLPLKREVVYGPRPMLIPSNWGLGTPENSEQKKRIAANRRCVYSEIIRTTSRRGRTGGAQCLRTETLVSVCVHGVQGMHSSNHCKRWSMLGHYHRKRLDALPLMLSKSYRRNSNPFYCRRPRQRTYITWKHRSCIKFWQAKVVSISTRSWRVMYPCVRTQRYDHKPLPFARAFSYLCSAVMMRLRSLSAAWPHRVVSLTLML